MKKRILWAATLLLAAALTDCKDDEGDFNDTFAISSDAVQFDGNTLAFGPDRLTVVIEGATETATGKWNAICPTEDVWCSFSRRGGELAVTVSLNDTNEPRSTWIEFSLGDNTRRIAVNQEYLRTLSFPGGNTATEGANAHAVSIPLQTNVAAANLSASVTDPASCDWITNLAVSATAVTFNLLRNPSASSTRPATITVQGEGKTASVRVTQNALSGYPYQIDLSGADFADCYIYEIWDQTHDMKIGELCLEYLHKKPDGADNPIVRKQATVAYPMKSGKVDLTNGLVVDDGHFVRWAANVTSTTPPADMLGYEEGETVAAKPTVIYLDEGAARMTTVDIEALPGDRVMAVLRPYKLRDQRSGTANNQGQLTEDYSYKVVKIGTQYWMAENLRSSRYADTGAPIPTDIGTEWANAMSPGCAIATRVASTQANWIDANDPLEAAVTARNTHGLVYNFHALTRTTAAKDVEMPEASIVDRLAPAGWSVPERAQFTQMCNYVFQATSLPGAADELCSTTYATGEWANASGFGATGNNSRSNSGTATGYNPHTGYMAIDAYTFRPPPGQLGIENQHVSTIFRIQTDTDNKPVWVANQSCQRAFYVRCLRD